MPGARAALDRLRAAGIATAVVSNQSGVALGTHDARRRRRRERARRSAARPARSRCWSARTAPATVAAAASPNPGLIEDAARALGVAPRDCVVVGDIGADVEAAHAAGARAILVPTAVTRAEEIDAAPVVARDLGSAVELLLRGGVWR